MGHQGLRTTDGSLAGGVGSLTGGGGPSSTGYGGFQAPDVVANLRVDQAWGSAQIAAAAHQVNAPYYVNTATAIVALPQKAVVTPTTSGAWRSAAASS